MLLYVRSPELISPFNDKGQPLAQLHCYPEGNTMRVVMDADNVTGAIVAHPWCVLCDSVRQTYGHCAIRIIVAISKSCPLYTDTKWGCANQLIRLFACIKLIWCFLNHLNAEPCYIMADDIKPLWKCWPVNSSSCTSTNAVIIKSDDHRTL